MLALPNTSFSTKAKTIIGSPPHQHHHDAKDSSVLVSAPRACYDGGDDCNLGGWLIILVDRNEQTMLRSYYRDVNGRLTL